MEFAETELSSVTLVRFAPREDVRGSFARLFCAHEFEAAGLPPRPVQTNLSKNLKRGTLRGLHFQEAPDGEPKLVQCLRGRIFDVAVDLRPHSPGFRQWAGFELSEDGGEALFIPEGFAHGFQTLEDRSWVLYHMFNFYRPDAVSGVRWNDPSLAIDWPMPNPIMSQKDGELPSIDDWLKAGAEKS